MYIFFSFWGLELDLGLALGKGLALGLGVGLGVESLIDIWPRLRQFDAKSINQKLVSKIFQYFALAF